MRAVLGVWVRMIGRGACVFPFLGGVLENSYIVLYEVLETLPANILENAAGGLLEGSITRCVDDVSYGY